MELNKIVLLPIPMGWGGAGPWVMAYGFAQWIFTKSITLL
jgi:hypothetical protein